MIDRGNILSSAGMTMLSLIISTTTLFFLYRFLLSSIGVEAVGIWSLVLSATSISRISEMGISGSVIKFVSKYLAYGNVKKAGKVVQTALLAISFVTALILVAAQPVIDWALSFFIHSDALAAAKQIVPYALLSLWISMMAGVLLSSLDGCQKISIRNCINILGNILYLPAAFYLVSSKGLVGLAYCQVLQSCFILIFAWIILRRTLNCLPILPYCWSREIFKEIYSYSIGLQVTSVMALLLEPITKGLLSKYGGLEMLGYFELASRMINQFRSLLISINQILVPVISRMHEISPEKINDVYLFSYRLLIYVSLPAYAGMIAMIPAISEVWIGSFNLDFVVMGIILAFGALFNSMVNPAYYINLAIGNLIENIIGYVTMAILNTILGYILGNWFGGVGVALAYVIAISFGGWVILVTFHLRQSIPLRAIFPIESDRLFKASIISSILTLTFYYFAAERVDIIILIISSLLVFFSAIAIPLWRHPMRKLLIGWVMNLS